MTEKMAKISNKIGALKERSAEFENEVREKTIGYIVTSFGLVAGLAWNDAIKTFIEEVFPMRGDTMKAKFVYAVVITAVVVFISLYLTRLFKKDIKKEGKEDAKIIKAKIKK